MRIVFFGTEEFAQAILETVHTEPTVEIALVVTQPPRPRGRGNVLTPSPVHQLALQHGLNIITPETLKDIETTKQIQKVNADLFLVVQYGLFIPNDLISMPRLGTLNIHPSLLPRHRGPTPIPGALLSGDSETGVTFMLIDNKMDHGPILRQIKLPIADNDNNATLFAKTTELAQGAINQVLVDWAAGKIQPLAQDETQVTFTKLLKRSDGNIDFNQDGAGVIIKKLRAFTPWPGVTLWQKDKSFKLIAAQISTEEFAAPAGTIKFAKNKLLVATPEKTLEILALQPANKKVLAAAEVISGYQTLDGEKFTSPPNGV